MNCTQARDAMLVADVAELKGRIDTPLGSHVAGCADCHDAAAVILRGTAELGAVVARRASTKPRRVSRLAIGLALAPIAAAAVFVIMLSSRTSRPVAAPRVSLAPLPVARTVSLEVGRGQQATVLKTADPKVTVIWLSSGEGK